MCDAANGEYCVMLCLPWPCEDECKYCSALRMDGGVPLNIFVQKLFHCNPGVHKSSLGAIYSTELFIYLYGPGGLQHIVKSKFNMTHIRP